MEKRILLLLDKFAQNKSISDIELRELKTLISDKKYENEIKNWFAHNWESANDADIEISYDGLKDKIQQYEIQQRFSTRIFEKTRQLSKYYQRIAAILFIPIILGLSAILLFSPAETENFYISEAPAGHKSKLELPDGSTVWLNSGSSIKYSSAFNKKDRHVELNGEAFFDVQKNTGKTFLVETKYVDIEVTGTQFNVNAYNDEPMVETALVEGKVNLLLKNQNKKVELDPGNVLFFSKENAKLYSSKLDMEASTAWKENRLIFINDDFDKLVRKMEKWFDIDVEYNPEDFKDNKLTVRLFEGEELSQLLKIIETATNARCTQKNNKVTITKK